MQLDCIEIFKSFVKIASVLSVKVGVCFSASKVKVVPADFCTKMVKFGTGELLPNNSVVCR